MKIYYSPFSPYVRKCLVVAYELGISDQLKLISALVSPVQPDQNVSSQNPLGKIPTLLTETNQVIFDSRVICEYLNNLVDGNIIPKEEVSRWRALTLQAIGDGILDAAVLLRYEEALRPENFRWNDWQIGQLKKVESALHYLNNKQEYFECEVVNIGNIAVACALWYLDLRFDGWNWRSNYPEVAKWYEQFSKRESMQVNWFV